MRACCDNATGLFDEFIVISLLRAACYPLVMDDKEAHNFTHTILKQIQADLTDLKQVRQEMREGFASIKSHMSGIIGDVFSHERRILNIEDAILRLKQRLGPDDPQH
jgi:hypothetical protein